MTPRRLAAFLILALAAAPALAASPVVPAPSSAAVSAILDRLDMSDGNIGWSGIRVDMHLSDVQELIGSPLTVKPGSEGDRPYDRYSTDVDRSGYRVHLAFDSDDADASVTFIGVLFPNAAPPKGLKDALLNRFPDLEPSEDGHGYVLPGSDSKIAVRELDLAMGKVWIFE
ncbi:MAG: hypothetical protein JO102_05875 [Elusimicrobia bacterium]|nr:hypothetical protein [Elusimicrobiota bacterium]